MQDALADGSAIGNQGFFDWVNAKLGHDTWAIAAPELGLEYTVTPEFPPWHANEK